MVDKLEETIFDNKSPWLSNPETYVLTHNRFISYMLLIFKDLNKVDI